MTSSLRQMLPSSKLQSHTTITKQTLKFLFHDIEDFWKYDCFMKNDTFNLIIFGVIYAHRVWWNQVVMSYVGNINLCVDFATTHFVQYCISISSKIQNMVSLYYIDAQKNFMVIYIALLIGNSLDSLF